MKVKATKRGTWPANRERAVGEVFDYDGPTKKKVGGKSVDYFPTWMEKVAAPEPEPDPEKAAAEKAAAEKAAAEKAAAEKAAAEKAGE